MVLNNRTGNDEEVVVVFFEELELNT